MTEANAALQQQLEAQRDAQAATVRQLKQDKADAALIKQNVDTLLQIKQQLAALSVSSGSGSASQPAAASGSSSAPAKYTLKTPKGTRDWEPLSMALRSRIFATITRIFESHGAVTIDTPVFELREILAGKYGEDSKLIYDLQDQGGEICSLRYDLTVPFARFVAMNMGEYVNIKRYHIAKVYRRDQPAMSKGRFREFYQCDFDIAGSYDPMLPDAECLLIVHEILTALKIEPFTIKINHRKILDGIFDICGVPADKIRPISSAVDKLDKMPWADVKREMIAEKGLDEAAADKIGEYVKLKGGEELLAQLEKDSALTGHKLASEGLKDMALLFKYLQVFNILPRISFDLSLARGLDYYTGLIYEAITLGSAPPTLAAAAAAAPPPAVASKKSKDKDEVDESTIGVGSISGGGRYDHLVGMFSGSKNKDAVPCVGISIGVERIFAILMAKLKEEQAKQQQTSIRAKNTQVFVMSMGGDGLAVPRLEVCKKLWDAGVKTEFLYKNKPKAAPQFTAIERDGTPLAVLIAPDEWAQGTVRVKEQRGKDTEEGSGKGEVVKLDELVGYVQGKIAELEKERAAAGGLFDI
ncbi:Cytoplasmic and mitochondrial histidine tRNA synthetase [Tilletia horrida]|uniref:Histidine--tRNA ligase, mitochondrial n=1 Tax=Tilletia horrida TaxID=155126 RepID=A0AAN6GL14_9BASI|nr:Cytoplasmic and mitochondrial histidine tRNA synthetase [Tilletia horrida]KAK0560392.1 Cytoplasmic and mitochondrial histidine tRNA synthetase [Tilletia horrida]